MLIGVDGNEANVSNRVGTGQYTFSLLKNWQKKASLDNQFRVYLSSPPGDWLPKKKPHFTYSVFGPKRLWTQIALPIKLFLEKNHAPSASDDECRKQWYEIYLPDGLSSLTGWVCGEYLLTISSDVFVPDIKANGQDGSITVSPSTPVSINISVDSGDKAGQNADWWIAVKTPFAPPGDWYTYVHPTGWMPGVNFCAQAGLFDLAPFEVLNMPLPVGTYTFYFALDDPDGMATGPWWGLDSVEVTVEY